MDALVRAEAVARQVAPDAARCRRRTAWLLRRLSFSAWVTVGAITPSTPRYTRVGERVSFASSFASAPVQAAASSPPSRARVTAAASASTNCRSRSRHTGTLPIRAASSAAWRKSCTIPTRHRISRAPGDTRVASIPTAASAGNTPPWPLAQK